MVLAAGFGAALALLAVPAFAQQAARAASATTTTRCWSATCRPRAPCRPRPTTAGRRGCSADLRARRVNDLVTVRVVENITASGSADSALDKKSNAAASVTKLFGAETKFPGWLDRDVARGVGRPTPASPEAAPPTAPGRSRAVITTRVIEVLPNSDLVLEGIREVDINGDRQFIVLSGIVRAADIGPGNVVPSTAVGQMQIRYFGKGLIKDNLKPGWIVRGLNKVF